VTGSGTPEFTWRPVRAGDFPLLARWLAQPHVARWWHHEVTPAAVARDFGPTVRGEEPNEDLLVSAAGRPVGLVQRCRWADYPDYAAEIAPLLTPPAGAMTIDYLIGEPELIGRGLGPAMIAAVVAATWTDHPGASCVIVPVAVANHASGRALEKAGFRRVASGLLPPDNPIDDGRHHVYRIDRP
jgi:aminoglycoside 6'-N-acetyltransferase